MRIKIIKDIMRSPSIKFGKGQELEVVYAKGNPFHKGHKVYDSKEYKCYIFEDECVELN